MIAITMRGGWQGDEFATRHGVFTSKDSVPRLQNDPSSLLFQPARQAGNRSQYLRGVERFLKASDYLTFAYVLALTPPLAARIGRTNGFSVCLSQESSTGKTLVARLAHSLTDRANESDLVSFGNTMGVTLTSLTSLGGQCIGFGDLKTDVNSRDAMQKLKTFVFSAASGVTRQGLNTPKRENPQFLIPIFSAERAVSQLFNEAKIPFEDGEAVRILEVPVPLRSEGGIFPAAGASASGTLARDLELFLSSNHGTIMPSWIRQLIHVGLAKLTKGIARLERQFLERFPELPAHQQRIINHFALVAAVGYFAAVAKVIPLSKERVKEVIYRVAWTTISALGRSDEQEISSWHRFFSVLDGLPTLKKGVAPIRTPDFGFVRIDDGVEQIFIRRDKLITALGHQFVDGKLLPQLKFSHCIDARRSGDVTVPITQKGIPRARYYRMRSADVARMRGEFQRSKKG